MKFKVGDRVRVVKTISSFDSKKNYIGKVFTIKRINKACEYPYSFEEDYTFSWKDEELESTPFTKSDLKDGMVVEYADGRRRMFLNDKVMGDDCYTPLIHFNDDLTHSRVNSNDIVKVYNSSACVLKDYRKDNYLTLVWERPEEPAKKMTVAEIEKELGYKVEIVSEVN